MNSKTNGTITIIKSDLLTKTKNSSIIKMMMLEPSKTVEILNHKPLQISIKWAWGAEFLERVMDLILKKHYPIIIIILIWEIAIHSINNQLKEYQTRSTVIQIVENIEYDRLTLSST